MDKSRYFTDYWSREDHLRFSDFRPVLGEILTSASTPLTMAIFGPWGSGKTTLLKMLQRDIEAKGHPYFRTVWFTAWKYDRQEALWRAFILRVLDALHPREPGSDPWEQRQHLPTEKLGDDQKKQVAQLQRLEESVYQPVDWEERGRWVIDWWQALCQVGKGSAEMAAALFPPAVALKPILKLLGGDEQISDELERTVASIRREVHTYHREQLLSMEQFENTFQEALRMILGERGRLVVFVDDLDRCLPEKAIEILETIKLFLEVEGTVFVVGMDKEVIERGIEVRYRAFFKGTLGEERVELPIRGDAYLQKIVQIPFHLPPMAEEDVAGFIIALEGKAQVPEPVATDLLTKFARERVLSSMTQRVLSRGLLPNPRQVKRVINMFRILQGISLVREERGSLPRDSVAWPLLAKTVLIQTQYPELYQQWRGEPRLVAWLEEEYTRRIAEEAEPEQQESKELQSDSIRSRLTEPFLRPQSWQQYALLERLLTDPPLAEDGRGRDRARFSTLSSAEVAVYLRLAGSVAMESVTAETLGDLWQEIESGESARVRRACAYLLDSDSDKQQGKARWLLRRRLESEDGTAIQRVAWAEALGRLGNLSPAIGALERLVRSESADVRLRIVDALEQIRGDDASKLLVALLRDERRSVQQAAIESLGRLGSASAVESLITQPRNRDSEMRQLMVATLLQIGEPAVEPLIALLTENDAYTLQVAAEGLGELSDSRAVMPIIALLEDKRETVRCAAADALGRLEDGRAAGPLVVLLEDSDPAVRQTAVRALARVGEPVTEPLIGLLKDPDPAVRQATVQALAQVGEPATEPLVDLLEDSDVSVRQAAVQALTHIGEPAMELVLNRLRDGHAMVRQAAVQVLAQMGEQVMGPLTAQLKDPDVSVRQSTVQALAQMGQPAVSPLIGQLADSDSAVRQSVVQALAQVGEPAVEPLLDYLSASDTKGQREVLEALVQMGEPAVEPLISRLGDKEEVIQQAAIRALIQIGESAAEPLIAQMEDRSASMRRLVIEILGQLGDLRAVVPLTAHVKDRSKYVRQATASALGHLGDARAVKPLCVLLWDKNEDTFIRIAAAGALGQLGDPDAADPLITVLGNRQEGITMRIAAAEALGQLGGERSLSALEDKLQKSWESISLRVAAAEALGQIGGSEAAKSLAFRLGDEDTRLHDATVSALIKIGEPALEPVATRLGLKKVATRREAVAVLAQIGGPRAVDLLIDQLREEESLSVRLAIAAGLGRLGDPRAAEPLEMLLKDPSPSMRRVAAAALEQLETTRTQRSSGTDQ